MHFCGSYLNINETAGFTSSLCIACSISYSQLKHAILFLLHPVMVTINILSALLALLPAGVVDSVQLHSYRTVNQFPRSHPGPRCFGMSVVLGQSHTQHTATQFHFSFFKHLIISIFFQKSQLCSLPNDYCLITHGY